MARSPTRRPCPKTMYRLALLFLILPWLLPCQAASAQSNEAQSNEAHLFPTPESLRPAVAFWTKVYTQSTDQGGFIHDDRRLNIVYDKISFPKGSSRKSQQKRLRKSVRHWRAVLLNLAKGKRTHLTKYEKRVLAVWGKKVSNKTLRAAANRVRFQRGQSNKFRAGVIRAGAFEPHIKGVLKKMGLPRTLAVLPHVESSFNPLAHSHVGAAGMWQFTRGTGKRYMRIDHVMDERLDPYKASFAAARLLKHNHDVLKAWPLAITAYNHGLAGMRRAVRTTGSRDMGSIAWRYQGRLFGFASRNFYAAFLAARNVSAQHEKYFGKLKRHTPQDIPTVLTPAYMPSKSVAKAVKVASKELRRLNPALKRSVWEGSKYIPKGFRLRLPKGYSERKAKNNLAKATKKAGYSRQKPDRYYRVRRGDSLSRIASRYGTSVRTLMNLNGLRSKHRIRVGQKLRLPGASTKKPGRLVVALKDPAPKAKKISKPAPTSVPAGSTKEYFVASGDSLDSIGKKLGVPARALARYNGLRDPDRIFVGQRLQVPGAKEEPPEEIAVAQAPAVELETKVDVAAAPTAEGPDESDPPSSGPAPVEVQDELSADPADYTVSVNGRIEVQATETLGHYADWLKVPTQSLRKLNRLGRKTPLTLGRKLKLKFTKVTPETFEATRTAYHKELQADYFSKHHIQGTKTHKVHRGDSLWALAIRTYKIPIWLMRQYNPDKSLDQALPPGSDVTIPNVVPAS